MTTIERSIREPASSFFLFGPRGTGKSTWLRERFPYALWIDLLRPAEAPEEVLQVYVGLYLREEVQAEGFVRNLGAFSRFLEATSFSHAVALNLTPDVARECQVSRSTVEGYLSVLEDLLLATRLPVFTRRARRQLVSRQKLYWFDAGVFGSLRPVGPLDRPQSPTASRSPCRSSPV